jgi:signal peptidase
MRTPSLRTVGTVLLAVAMVFLVAVFVVQAAPGVIGAEESYVVLSGSMEPEISPGDAVVVQSVDPASVEAGDVITYKRGSDAEPVTHRVVEVVQQDGERAFRTQGDANEDPDPSPVAAETLVGEVWFTIPLVGHVVLFANTVLGRVVLVGLPLLALAVSELYDFFVAGDDDPADGSADDQDVVTEAGDGPSELFADEASGDESVAAADSGDGTAPEQTTAARTTEPAVRTAESDGITLTTYDLRLSSVSFGLLAVYSGYMAFSDPSPVRVSIFAGAAMVLVFFAGMFVFGGGSPQPARASRTDGGSSAGETGSAHAGSSTPDVGQADSGDSTDGGDTPGEGDQDATAGGEADAA